MQKFSRKREAILNALAGTTEHPSAEWVYSRLKPVYPDISLGTVYRNLSAFVEDGTVIVVGSVNGRERYDFRTEPHAHFICDACGCVMDVEPSPEQPDFSEAEALMNVRVHRLDQVLHGLCADCTNKEGQ